MICHSLIGIIMTIDRKGIPMYTTNKKECGKMTKIDDRIAHLNSKLQDNIILMGETKGQLAELEIAYSNKSSSLKELSNKNITKIAQNIKKVDLFKDKFKKRIALAGILVFGIAVGIACMIQGSLFLGIACTAMSLAGTVQDLIEASKHYKRAKFFKKRLDKYSDSEKKTVTVLTEINMAYNDAITILKNKLSRLECENVALESEIDELLKCKEKKMVVFEKYDDSERQI